MKKFTKLFFTFSALLMLVSSVFAFGQSRITVSGRVIDGTGAPVIGAGVVLSNNRSVGTTTDIDGTYTISVPSNAVLEVSCIGYKTQNVSVAGKTTLNVLLEEDNEFIEETVVIGYGVQKKSDVTGSVASVRAAELSNRSTTDAAAALQCREALAVN